MLRSRRPHLFSLPVFFALISCVLIAANFSFAAATDRITSPIVSAQAARVSGSVPRFARAQSDRGAVDSSLKLEYITLLTVPSASQKQALSKLIADQQNPASPSYHKWLTPEQYADRFGLSPNDIQKLTNWLQSEGFTVVRTARGRNWIVFSGTAGQVEKTFQTEIHNYEVKGEAHFANMTPPAFPAALAGIVTGLRGLNDFRPKSQAKRGQPNYTFALNGGDYIFLAPGDIKTMYDVSTLYGDGIDGTGQTVAVMGETGVYQSDLTNFRQNFGLSAINCSVSGDIITSCNTSNFKYVLVNGTATSVYDDLPEADLDIEWSGATARNAQIIFVTSNSTSGGFVWDSWYHAVDNNIAPVITMSYTAPCEFYEARQSSGEGSIVSDEAELAKANSEGITFMNSSGDTGVAEGDNYNKTGTSLAEDGYAVGYPASSASVTGVGGTLLPFSEYTETYFNPTNDSNGDGGSATMYVPEQAWNDSLEFAYLCESGNNKTTNSLCVDNGIGDGPLLTDWENVQLAVNSAGYPVIGIAAGGGGPSNCVSMDANQVCKSGFPQPTWQSGLNVTAINPSGLGQENSTKTRLSPDISLAASANFPGYLVCTQVNGSAGGGSSCDSPSTGIKDMLTGCINGTGPCTIFGGTSVSTPIFAGMVSLLNQEVVAKGLQAEPGLGNINPTLYRLAASNSTNGAFNPVTTSSSGVYSNGVWCDPGSPSTGIGGDPWPVAMACPSTGTSLLSFNTYNFDATTNYNLAVGLGSVNLSHLAAALVASNLSTTTTPLTSSLNPANQGVAVTFTATVTTTGANQPTGTVNFDDAGTQIGSGTLSTVGGAQVATFTTSTLSAGTHSITAIYVGDTNNAGSTSTAVSQVIVGAPTFTLAVSGASTTVVNQNVVWNGTLTAVNGYNKSVTISCTSGAPATCTPSPVHLFPTASGATFTVTMGSATTGTFNFSIQGTDGTITQSQAVSLRVNGSFTVPATLTNPPSANPGQSTTTGMLLTPTGGSTFTTSVTYACSGLPAGATCSFSPASLASGASATTVQVTVNTAGPFTGAAGGLRHGDGQRKIASTKERLWLPLSLPLSGLLLVGVAGRGLPRRYKIIGLCLTMALPGFLVACGGGSSSNPPPSVVTVSPSSVGTLYPNLTGAPAQMQQFSASVSNSSSQAVTWAVAGGSANGTIDQTGLYTAPAALPSPNSPISITATSTAATAPGTASVSLLAPTPPGNSTITVTVTEGTVVQTTKFTLTVAN